MLLSKEEWRTFISVGSLTLREFLELEEEDREAIASAVVDRDAELISTLALSVDDPFRALALGGHKEEIEDRLDDQFFEAYHQSRAEEIERQRAG